MNKKIKMIVTVVPIAIALFGYEKVSNTLGIQLTELLTNKGLMIPILAITGISTFILKIKRKLNLFKCFVISFIIIFCVCGFLGLGSNIFGFLLNSFK